MPSINAVGLKKNLMYTPSNIYKDRSTSEAMEFAEFILHVKTPRTVILLLESDENEIVLNALNHLNKFAMKSPQNLQKLNQLKVIDNIMENNLIEHSELFIRRFALKIIAQTFQEKILVSTFENELIRDVLNKARKLYIEIKDNFIVEYSARILLALLSDPRLSADFQNDLQFISEGLYKHIGNSKDPDILHISYQILSQILRERFPVETICDVDDFPFERVLGDMSKQFPEIRKSALETMTEMALYNEDNLIVRFSCQSFFEEFFKIIENSEYGESHCHALKLLKRIVRHPPVARILFTQYLDRFNVFWRSSTCVEEGVQVYYEISAYQDAWQHLYTTGVIEQLADRLKDITSVSYELCMVLSKAANHPESFLIIMQPETVLNLMDIIQDPHKNWKTKGASLETLNMLCKKSYKACQSTLNQNISTILSTILNKKYGEIPSEVYTNVLNLLVSLAKVEDIQANVMTNNLAGALINATKNLSRSAVLSAHLFNTLSIFNNNSNLRECLKSTINFWDVVLNFLKSPSIFLRNSVAEFIMHTGKSKNFAELYADKGILDFLLGDCSSIISCLNWSTAIDSILSADLSLKFNIRGRLDFTDITNDNFFICKHYWEDVATFRSMIKDEVSPRYTLILVNFDHRECCEGDIVRVPKVCSDGIALRSQDDCTYCRRPNDPYLPRYLEKARNAFETEGFCKNPYNANATRINIAKIADRAMILAIIINEVFHTTAGEENRVCSEEIVTQHLNELKCELNCNIIPLGLIRYGGHFERAVLFKTLADKTGVPSTLQRGEDAKILWNELPVLNIQTEILPKQHLRPTHIVDLIEHPGALYPIGSRKASEYIRLCIK